MISKNYFRINDETNIRFNDWLSLYNTNEAMSNYGHYGKTMGDDYITVSNSGMDELFEVLKEKHITFQKDTIYADAFHYLQNIPSQGM